MVSDSAATLGTRRSITSALLSWRPPDSPAELPAFSAAGGFSLSVVSAFPHLISCLFLEFPVVPSVSALQPHI